MSQKNVLVAVDGSEYSSQVIDKAIEYCRLTDAKVLLVYCHRRFSHIISHPPDEEISQIKKQSQDLIDPYIARLRQENIEVEDRLMEEPAGHAITEIARIEKSDIIIMGSRGLSNLAVLIVGSVTSRVLQTASCSVLVVR